jgi:hypothetical protein
MRSTTFKPTLRPIRVNHNKGKVAAKVVIPNKTYLKDKKDSEYLKKAIIASLCLHVLIIIAKFPGTQEAVAPKEKLAAIKMNMITPPESYKILKKKIAEEMTKIDTQMEAGVKKVTTNEQGPTGDPNAANTVAQKSKKGSAKNGPLSSPDVAGATGVGDSNAKGYEFKGRGLKALMGDSSKMAIAAGSGEGSRGVVGTGIGNKGNNLTGDYRAPAGMGDGSGHLLGKDVAGNYDRSTSASRHRCPGFH